MACYPNALCVITGREKSISIDNKGENPDPSPAPGIVSMDIETGVNIFPSRSPSNAIKDHMWEKRNEEMREGKGERSREESEGGRKSPVATGKKNG